MIIESYIILLLQLCSQAAPLSIQKDQVDRSARVVDVLLKIPSDKKKELTKREVYSVPPLIHHIRFTYIFFFFVSFPKLSGP